YVQRASEQAWTGATSAPPARRLGLDLVGSLDAASWLALDANVTWSPTPLDGTIMIDGLALAPRWMGTGGATVHGDAGFIALRARGFADRPSSEAADRDVFVDVIAGKQLGAVEVVLAITNASDRAWTEPEIATPTRVSFLANDVSRGGVDAIEDADGAPLTATLTAAYAW
ncbi:MAG: hypothetical protein H0T89_11265, partial [Deltaproteobacteria bacterium]|nr:hypothetical protein [Deltaproteobacteria bacterium]